MSGIDLGTLRLQLIWNRLVGLVEEQAQTLIRTAFSQAVRESGDLSAGVFDRSGRMVAQAITGTPGHVNSMAVSIIEFLRKYPIDAMKPGDVYITNDPWLSVGHYHDVTVATPAFHRGRAVAIFANTIHIIDMGGRGFGPDARQVFEEGINIPILPLAREGRLNEDLLEMLRTNVREPVQMEGDLHSQLACNADAARRLSSMLAEFDLPDLEAVGDHIVSQSETALRARIRALPRGSVEGALRIDGYDEPITLKARLTVGDGEIHVDYDGTTPVSPYGINVVMNFTTAYTVFGINCIVAPDIPCNAGSLAPIRVSAPPNTIVNVQRPYPVSARHTIGQMLPDLMFGCLTQILPERVPAEGAGTMWNPMLRGGPSAVDPSVARDTRRFTRNFDTILFNCGGTGARPTKDGLHTTAFPSGVRTVPAEAVENTTPMIVWRKEFREGSAGAGRWRGGVGQVLEVGCEDDAPFSVAAMFERTKFAARGFQGGRDGAAGIARLKSGMALRGKGRQTIPDRDRLHVELPGGAGWGDPLQRESWRVAEDVADDLVTREQALSDYGVVIGSDGRVDEAATRKVRESRR
ncbi:MAG: hydantoinase B/oxoprolinase family protein [Alphaproteobacteria bacterium]|nr:hydantoinase B/oxoprolinase family protein [Alphaproteobacteria bacterium]